MAPANLLSMLFCFILFALSTAAPAFTALVIAPNCSHDNCLRQFIRNAPFVTTFCATYTTSSASAPLSTFVSQCSGVASRISSACSCIVTTTSTSSSPSATVSETSHKTPAVDGSIKMVATTSSSSDTVSETGTTATFIPTSVALTTNPQNSLVSIEATSTTSSASPIHSKSGLNRADPSDCNFEGLPSTVLLTDVLTALYAPTILDCQTTCENFSGAGPCLSYAWQAPAAPNFGNCQLFSVPFTGETDDGIDLVIKDIVSGMYFSNRYPADESGFCYS